ncbi:glycosyltransferase [Aspergillus stella-maris]|uniref:glycosyltransferase n=1 Tax=Aspergillus stella-maris TaxID=1810926 RepID=UPI003CCCD71C
MHVAFLSNPASGEVNVQLATAQQLVSQGHSVTFLSAEACRSKVDRFQQAQEPCSRELINFISLGSGAGLDDYTAYFKSRMHRMRNRPGDPISFQTCIEAALSSPERHAAIAVKVRDHLDELNPSMICVDALSPSLITGARLTNRKFILTIPCSPGLSALPGLFEPNPVGANRRGSWGTFFENMYLDAREFIHSRHRDRRSKRALLSRQLGLKSYGRVLDTSLLPPHWDDPNCVAGIHFNIHGLNDCPKQSPKIVFVGAGISTDPPNPSPSTPLLPQSQPEPEPQPEPEQTEQAWMDEAILLGEDIVYINMGSMFIWTPAEFRACIAGFSAAHRKLNGRVRFLFKINHRIRHASTSSSASSSTSASPEKASNSQRSQSRPDPESESDLDAEMRTVPPFIRLTTWIESQHAVYAHPALKAFVHHGGGNSFNEAVHFAVPQLVLSRWLDTHEYAGYAEQFGLGLRSANPPSIEAADVEGKILALLGSNWEGFKDNCRAWAMRSRLGGGAETAAEIVLFHARVLVQGGARGRGVGSGSGSGSGSSRSTGDFSGSTVTPPLNPTQLEKEAEGEIMAVGL